jgi:hypothetical protein
VDKLKTLPETNADNALYLGLAVHKGLETGSVEEAIAEYKSHYNVLTDENINWIMQLEYQIPRAIELLPTGGEHELEVELDNFIGFIDYVCGDTLYDFKFSNNVENYRKSPQLSLYKYFLEQVRPDLKINQLKYIMIPKINIRQKKNETVMEFRQRLKEHLEVSEIQIVEVPYDGDSVTQFLAACQQLEVVDNFPKNPTRLCGWCQYQKYCESNGEIDWMII